jgi:hypothetical protein
MISTADPWIGISVGEPWPISGDVKLGNDPRTTHP